jgi:hypothetical protein
MKKESIGKITRTRLIFFIFTRRSILKNYTLAKLLNLSTPGDSHDLVVLKV